MCLKESCFPDYLRVLPVILTFENVEGRSITKNYHPVSLLSVVIKSLKNLEGVSSMTNSKNAAIFLIFRMVSGLLN